MKIAGLMSGTSLDGLSIALISVERPESLSTSELKRLVRKAEFLDGETYAFPKSLREDLSIITSVESKTSTAFLAAAHSKFGKFGAGCLTRFVQSNSAPDLIGFHGQTVYHAPGTLTVTF